MKLKIDSHEGDRVQATLTVIHHGIHEFLLTGTAVLVQGNEVKLDLRGPDGQTFVLTRQPDGRWVGEGIGTYHAGPMTLITAE